MEEIVITNFEGVYEPAEDSWLISKHIPKFEGNVLEIGSGTGILSIHLAKRGHQVTAIDLNPKAVEATKSNAKNNKVNIEILEGNMFNPVKNRKFDVIVCNPPYLPPADDYDDPELALAVEGGSGGSEFTIKFLTQAKNYVHPSGSIYMILSSRMKDFKVDWERNIIKQEKYFFERLNLVHFF